MSNNAAIQNLVQPSGDNLVARLGKIEDVGELVDAAYWSVLGRAPDADEAGTTVLGESARHRRGSATAGPGRADDADDTSGPGRRSRSRAEERDPGPGGKKKRKGSFWRELPLLVVVAIVLTFVIQTFIARIYVIPSASMEQTLHGCDGCANDRVAVDKVTRPCPSTCHGMCRLAESELSRSKSSSPPA